MSQSRSKKPSNRSIVAHRRPRRQPDLFVASTNEPSARLLNEARQLVPDVGIETCRRRVANGVKTRLEIGRSIQICRAPGPWQSAFFTLGSVSVSARSRRRTRSLRRASEASPARPRALPTRRVSQSEACDRCPQDTPRRRLFVPIFVSLIGRSGARILQGHGVDEIEIWRVRFRRT